MEKIDVFAVLANPVRRRILMRLRKGPRGVSDLASAFTLGRPAVSEHLQVLRRARLIREEPRGRERFYHLDPRPLRQVEEWMGRFAKTWNDRLDALGELPDSEPSQ